MPRRFTSSQARRHRDKNRRSRATLIRPAFTSCAFALLCITAQADVAVRIEIKPGKIAVAPDPQSGISEATNSSQLIRVDEPREIENILNAIKQCSSNVSGWDKAKFLQDFSQEEAKINATATLIAKSSSVFLSGSHPLVNASAFPSMGDNLRLPDNVRRFLEDARNKGIDITIIETHGIPGTPITDPDILKAKGLVTKDDIGFAVSSYLSEALPRLYSWLRATPSSCYSAEQLKLLEERLHDTFAPASGIRAQYGGGQLIEIECGNGKTSSRLKVPGGELRPVVLKALKHGPWPFGPAGMYFSRSWFLRNAVWQMYARESHEFRDNLTVDVADYSCGPP